MGWCVIAKAVGMEKVWKKIFKKPDEGIIIGGNADEQKEIIDTLNMLTDDELDKYIAYPSGICYVIIKEEREIEHRPLGTKLIRDLIQQERPDKIVKIFIYDGESYTQPTNKNNFEDAGKDEDWRKARNRLLGGADAIIGINMRTKYDVPTTNSGGHLEIESIPYHIALAHELIHAYHMVNGKSKQGEQQHIYEYLDETEILQKIPEDRPVDIEELYTIGLTDEYKNEYLTENKIREEQNKTREEQQEKLNIRIAYWGNYK